ncbi:uncharacterized protein LOC135203955 [Macrobrachium nipponense]|uniref:uncharacterized protein LOC135203955 n=1 Tax=Macrobrachium nipponense TaxID=159736 RepID=UPI0030C7C519
MVGAFERLKEEAARDVTLAFPDYSEEASEIELYTDASEVSVGGCLAQMQEVNGEEQLRVIAYVSKAFNKAERKYSVVEKELAAIRFCVKVLKVFLYGVKFIIRTDHRPLMYMIKKESVNARIARTIEDLSEFDFRLEYVPGSKNVIADAMSRMHGRGNGVVKSDWGPNVVPEGLVVRERFEGDDRVCECLFSALKDLEGRGLVEEVPGSANELLVRLMSEVQRGVAYAEEQDGEEEMLRKLLLAVAELFGIKVVLYFGWDRPFEYQGRISTGSEHGVLRIQCGEDGC